VNDPETSKKTMHETPQDWSGGAKKTIKGEAAGKRKRYIYGETIGLQHKWGKRD